MFQRLILNNLFKNFRKSNIRFHSVKNTSEGSSHWKLLEKIEKLEKENRKLKNTEGILEEVLTIFSCGIIFVSFLNYLNSRNYPDIKPIKINEVSFIGGDETIDFPIDSKKLIF